MYISACFENAFCTAFLTTVDVNDLLQSLHYNRYIRDVYKRVRRNEDGTMNIEIQKQKAKVDEICGYQTVKGNEEEEMACSKKVGVALFVLQIVLVFCTQNYSSKLA